jgi:hypothetical protein
MPAPKSPAPTGIHAPAHIPAAAPHPAPAPLHVLMTHSPLHISVVHVPFDWSALVGTAAALLLVGVTYALAYFTLQLWRATKALVEGGEKTATRQLRAYVGVDSIALMSRNVHSTNYARPEVKLGEISPDRIIIHLKNFGSTPANRVDVSCLPATVTPVARLPDVGPSTQSLTPIKQTEKRLRWCRPLVSHRVSGFR